MPIVFDEVRAEVEPNPRRTQDTSTTAPANATNDEEQVTRLQQALEVLVRRKARLRAD